MIQAPCIDREFQNLIPQLTEEEYQQLERNILSGRRCREAVLSWDGFIVDAITVTRYAVNTGFLLR